MLYECLTFCASLLSRAASFFVCAACSHQIKYKKNIKKILKKYQTKKIAVKDEDERCPAGEQSPNAIPNKTQKILSQQTNKQNS